MKIASFLSLFLIAGFLFVGINRLHPVGQPLGNQNVFIDRTGELTDITYVDTMDDYYLRNGQRETGSNNIVASVVFDYRGFDTMGEASVLFLVVTSISMLLYPSIRLKRDTVELRDPRTGFPMDMTRIVSNGTYLMFPLILAFGAYLVIHGHLSPGGGFQGGAVMASGTALLIISSYITSHLHRTYNIFSFFESLGLTIFIGIGFAGIGVTFLSNFLANGSPAFFGRVIDLGPNSGYLNSAGLLPFLSLAIGMEVFFGLSIILVSMFHLARKEKDEKGMIK
jgi:multicomponent Na+:H+ antiporter subunit B